MYFVYLLRCKDGSIYTGITTDVKRREREHQGSKKGAHYTRAKGAVSIVYEERKLNRSTASRREAEIKKWPRLRKLELIRNGKPLKAKK